MRKILFLINGFLLISQLSFGQAASDYYFTAVSGNYISLEGVPGVVDTSLGATADAGVSTDITLPFAFTFAGTVYSTIKVSPNGWLSFGTASVSDAQNNTNSLANAGVAKPILFPLWDDLMCTVKPRYITTGIFPHRRFKVEWSQQKWNAQASGDVISFQVWFFETTNVVEFLYNQGATAVTNGSSGASIGICDANGKYLTLTNSSASPTTSYSVFTDNISAKPATGQIYRFSPLPTTGLEASKYCFSASNRTYTSLTNTTVVPGIGSADDDALSDAVTLQFPFTFGSNVYTDVRVSSNGWLTFGSPTISATQNYTNTAVNAGVSKPILMPLWDNLKCTFAPIYVTDGVAPNRIFKVEWYRQKWNYTSPANVITFEVWLYEGSNKIEYHYYPGGGSIKSPSATIGIYDANGNYLTLNNSGASPTAQSSTFTSNIATSPAQGQVYEFTPPPVIIYPGNAYIAIGKVAVTQTGVSGGTYSSSPPGLVINSSTGEVNLATSAGGTFTIVYSVAGCANATTAMTIFPLLPVPTATITPAACTTGTDGTITITNMNNAIKFIRADNDYVDLGSPLLSGKSAFTVEGWIKFNLADVTGRMSLFGQNDAIEFGFANSTTIELSTPATGAVTAALPPSLGDGAWHHIAAVGNGSTVKIYLNGVSVAVMGGAVSTSNYGTSSFTTKIGSGVYNATGDSFTGQIMKIGLYNKALSAIDISNLAIGVTTYSGYEAGIIAGYNIYVGSGTTIYSYPAGNNGTFQNSPEWIDPYTYVWQKIGSSGNYATTKSLINLAPGDYKVTVSLLGVSSPNSTTFTVGSSPGVTAIDGSGASCANSFTANWNASGGAIYYVLDVATDIDFTNFVSGFNGLNVGNVTNYVVTGLPAGNIFYRVHKHSSCGESTPSNVISYATLQISSPTAAAATNELCNGFTANWNAVSGATAYYLDVSTDPSFSTFVTGYNSQSVGNVTSLAISSLASGFTYYYRVRSSNATCGIVPTPSNVISIGINTGPTAPVVGTIQQITCATPGASVVLSGLPAGNWILKFSSGESYSGSGSTVTIPNLTPGTYTAAVTDDFCFSANSTDITVSPDPISTTLWNGTTWSNGTPTLLKRVIFDGGVGNVFTVGSDLSMCSCQITSGSVNVPSGIVLSVHEQLDILSTASLTFENNASLVQTNDVAHNNGAIVYKRLSSLMKDFDYTYWCSPVLDQKLNLLSPNSGGYYYSAANGNWVHENGNNTMNTAGKGFIIRVPRPGVLYPNLEYWTGTYNQPVQFIGEPYNGIITIASQGVAQVNLIGNPYPSAIKADDFITKNAVILGGALYFWTHITPRTQVGSQYVYSASDYATYTLTGGTGTAPAVSGGPTPSGYIAAGQSFFVESNAVGNFEFNNSMRISEAGRNGNFFKMDNTKKTAATEKNRVWLNLTNAEGAFKQLLVGYIQGATNGLDNLYDGVSFDGNAFIDFYSINSDMNLAIQGRAIPFDENDQVPLGYKTTIKGVFEISIDHSDGVLANKLIYLEDKTTNVIHNLTNGAYSFDTEIGEFKNRFVLRYTSSSLGTGDFEANGKSVIVSVKNHQIKINSFDDTISLVKVYDLKGSLLFEKNNINKNEFSIGNLASSDQFLVVSTQLTNGQRVSQKILFNN